MCTLERMCSRCFYKDLTPPESAWAIDWMSDFFGGSLDRVPIKSQTPTSERSNVYGRKSMWEMGRIDTKEKWLPPKMILFGTHYFEISTTLCELCGFNFAHSAFKIPSFQNHKIKNCQDPWFGFNKAVYSQTLYFIAFSKKIWLLRSRCGQ